jgi:hypothetical protein
VRERSAAEIPAVGGVTNLQDFFHSHIEGIDFERRKWVNQPDPSKLV